ncbi:MAG TPA: hypothetical protein DCF66_04125 [Lachnospiraceae bacterium]|nr:hypothetical protein [Lachnospiraceae bacterium]
MERTEKLSEELEKVVGGGDFSQVDLEVLASLLTMESKGNLIDLLNGKCPKCKKIIAAQGTPGFSAIVKEHYLNCKGN